MRFRKLSILLALGACTLVARANDLTAGSTFTYTLEQYDNTAGAFATYTSWTSTPGATVPFAFGASIGTLSESHTALAGGNDMFTFTFSALSDLFPEYTPGDDYQGLFGIEGLQFNSPFQPTSAILTFSSPNGVITFNDGSMATGDLISYLSNPFDGNVIAGGGLTGYDMIGGLNTTNITLQLSNAPLTNANTPPPVIVATPEPSSLALLATGLLGTVASARRRLFGL